MTEEIVNPRIDELNNLLNKELTEWEKLGVDPVQVMIFNPFKVETWLRCLTKHLSSKGVIDEDEFVIYMKEQQLESLQEMRADVEIKMRKAKLQGMGVSLPGNMAVPKEKIQKH